MIVVPGVRKAVVNFPFLSNECRVFAIIFDNSARNVITFESAIIKHPMPPFWLPIYTPLQIFIKMLVCSEINVFDHEYRYPYPRSNWLRGGSFLDFCFDFHKILVIRSSVCRTRLIRRALESPDPCASNGGSNFIFRHFGADMAAFKVAGWSIVSNVGQS